MINATASDYMIKFGGSGELEPSYPLLAAIDVVGVAKLGVLGARALANSRVNVADKLTPSEYARSLQGSGNYPGKDVYRDITLKKGKIIYGGTPGQSEFYTTKSALNRSDFSSGKLFDGLQVAPGNPAYVPVHSTTGLNRPGVTAYEVTSDIPAAFGRTLANPGQGSGGLPQIVIENYQDFLKPIYSIPLKK